MILSSFTINGVMHMSLESAIRIFKEQGFKEPQRAVEVIRRAVSLDDLGQIMRDENTGSNATQFVHFRIMSLFKDDQEFARKTLDTARARYQELGLPREIVDYYISNGGGTDTAISLGFKEGMGLLPRVENLKALDPFAASADFLLLAEDPFPP